MEQSEVQKIINQLKTNEIGVLNISPEYQNSIEIVYFEREAGLRITGKRGFDIISNAFFVNEELVYKNSEGKEDKKSVSRSFEDFDSYYVFLNGDIYNNACYTFCPPFISSHKIDFEKLMARKSFVEDTIDDYSIEPSRKEKEDYEKGRRIHKQCQQWVKKFNDCQSYNEFVKVTNNYKKSKLCTKLKIDVAFFFFQYIFADIKDKHRFSVIMEYMSSGADPESKVIDALCLIYNPDDVMQAFNSTPEASKTSCEHKPELKEYIRLLKKGEIEFKRIAFFDTKTHYYCEKTVGYPKRNNYFRFTTICRCFDTFSEFIDYRHGNLTNCDLSKALECDADFSHYIINETTKLPVHSYPKLTYSIEKYYYNKKFFVIQLWRNDYGRVIKLYQHPFDYFFDFVAFLKSDLSDANLIYCDGLKFLKQWDTINFTNAKMRSSLCEKFGLKYNVQKINTDLIKSFDCVEQNEKETALVLQESRNLIEEVANKELLALNISSNYHFQKVHYISDIHLMYRIANAGCRSKEDIIYVIQKIVNTIASEITTVGHILLIDGDVASDFDIFKLFVKMLSRAIPQQTQVVFTLGNHELWCFPGYSIEQITSKYRTVLAEYGMYLLQNDLLYKEDSSLFVSPNAATHLIKYNDLCQMNETQIADRLRNARYVILGGLGFSGYNTEFNADDGVYQTIVNRQTEIKESKIFEDLYNRLNPILSNKNTIILTHMPKKDWCRNGNPNKNYVYVSGHTHKNFFHDDGEYRIYSDNQIGYNNEHPHLKSFFIDSNYDCFSNYDDGIFEITREQYKDFYLGENISMDFNLEVNILYMLKRNGYYCFIHKTKQGDLNILNGGAMKKLEVQDIQYYYDNMDSMISTIKKPLEKFTSFQKNIANEIKKIGGNGTIHGCIIDIDFYDHVYVNPIDGSVTGYWAFNVINKIVYSSIPALLEENCPEIFDNYNKLLKDNDKNLLVPKQQTNVALSPQIYLDTDIYKASREIMKMQKLGSKNILSSWYEDTLHKNLKIEHT